MLLEDVIGRRLFKALLPRIRVLLVRIAGFPAVNIESPVGTGNGKGNVKFLKSNQRSGKSFLFFKEQTQFGK